MRKLDYSLNDIHRKHQAMHLTMLKNAKPAIDTTSPKIMNSTLFKQKDTQTQLARENFRIFARLTHIQGRDAPHKYKRSIIEKKAFTPIKLYGFVSENIRIAKQLQEAKSVYNYGHDKERNKKQLSLLKNISKWKRRCFLLEDSTHYFRRLSTINTIKTSPSYNPKISLQTINSYDLRENPNYIPRASSVLANSIKNKFMRIDIK